MKCAERTPARTREVDRLLPFLRKLFAAAFIIYMSVIAAGILFLGGLFAWKLATHDRAKAVFEAPNGRWSLHIEESCLLGACHKYPTVVVPEGWFSSRELQCQMHDADTSRVLFDKVQTHEWGAGDSSFSWTAGDPPVSGRIDLREDCGASIGSFWAKSRIWRDWPNCCLRQEPRLPQTLLRVVRR